MMESPIPEGLWKTTFHVAATGMLGAIAFSIWRQGRDQRAAINGPLSKVNKARDVHERLEAITEILNIVTDEVRTKKGITKLVVQDNFDAFVKHLKLNEDLTNGAVVEATLKLVQKTCTDARGRHAFYAAGGYRRIMAVMSDGYRHGVRKLMEDSALTLQLLTRVDDNEVVLPADVPYGAEGARSLCDYNSTVNMLKTLDPSSPIVFLTAVTGVFANLCMLHAGATKIGAGVDGTPAAVYFRRLLDHGNPVVVEHCARALRFLARATVSHDIIADKATVQALANLLDPNKDPAMVSSIQTIILVMLDSKHSATFFANLEATDALQSLFLIWCRGPEKAIRDRAEVLIHLMDRTGFCSDKIRKLTETHRSLIMERKARDEEEKKARYQQMKQQQAFQQMMMQQMGGGDMAAMMGGGDE